MTQSNASATVYLSDRTWNANRPRVLVVAYSDGRLQQDADADDVLLHVFGAHSHLKLRAFRAEVRNDGKVQFVDLLA